MSSDEEGIARPGRAAGNQSPAHNNKEDHDDGSHMDEDDNDDLFGSDGEGGLDDIEYASSINKW